MVLLYPWSPRALYRTGAFFFLKGNVPYYDNDFEVFIDVSGTNHWYKEFATWLSSGGAQDLRLYNMGLSTYQDHFEVYASYCGKY